MVLLTSISTISRFCKNPRTLMYSIYSRGHMYLHGRVVQCANVSQKLLESGFFRYFSHREMKNFEKKIDI